MDISKTFSKTFSFTPHKYLSDWYTQVYKSLSLTGWVILGLGLITLLVAMLARFPDWFGPIFFGPKTAITIMRGEAAGAPGRDIFMITVSDANNLLSILMSVVVCILLYIVITLIQPRPSLRPHLRMLYLLAFSLVLLLIGIVVVPTVLPTVDVFHYCLVLYAFIAYARVVFSKKQGLLVEGVVLAIVLFILVASSQTHAVPAPKLPVLPGSGKAMAYEKIGYHINDANQLLLRIPLLGIQVGWTVQWFEAFIWATGLLCLHVFTGIGVHERAARQHSERLVAELTRAQEQLRAYALHAEELATMRERTRVAREVHDTLAQGLAAIKMHLETGSKVFSASPDLAQKHIERARELAGEYLQETRNSILDLRISVLQGRTLPDALAELAASTHGAVVNLKDIKEEEALCWQTLSPASELACYRVVQEALSNATRHGQASHIDIELSIEQDALCLTITDDGRGFEPGELPRDRTGGGGFGIIGMHERLKQLSGRLEIISAPGAGTQVVAMIPLASAQKDRSDTKERLRSKSR